MATQPRNKYDCSQAELYAICYLAWNICKQHQVDIEIVFPEYTIAYVDGKIASVTTAEELPDFQNRDYVTETAHILLTQIAERAVSRWGLLERYITRALQNNKPLIKPNVEAAGKQYYEGASRENPNWEDVKHLLVDGNSYITDNMALLTPVMPAAFPAEFGTSKTDFDTQYLLFTTEEFNSPAATFAKITANNGIYDDLLLLIDDIKGLAPVPESNLFSFAYFKGIISSPGPAGLKGTLTEAGTGITLDGILCRIIEGGYETTSNALGVYDFGNIASGSYTLEFSKDGYQTLTLQVKIFTGVTSTKNYELVKNP